jgi:uncharacterized protein YcbX
VAACATVDYARRLTVNAIVRGLFVYPVKSCRGIALERGTVGARGLCHDRRWMVVDDTGQFVTQRTQPRLALVDVAITQEALVLSAPQMPALRLPLVPMEGAARRRVRVWRDEVDALDCGGPASRWLSDWLNMASALVFMPDSTQRAVDPKHARDGDIVGFADAFPLLLASESSLEDLNRRLERPVPMDRFRPNVVVGGCPAWAEDSWKRIHIADVPIRVLKPCSRCVITTTDQGTAERGVEPLRTLATFRTENDHVLFAQNCAPDKPGTLRIQDEVTVLECA